MQTKQSYYRNLPENEPKKAIKSLSSYPKDVQNIVNEIVKLKFKNMVKKHSKTLAIIFKILIKGEKNLNLKK